MKFSYSRVSSYRQCKQQHYFGYIEEIKPKTTSRPLSFGGDIHRLLEATYGNERNIFDELAAIRDTYENLTEDKQMSLGETYLEDLETVLEDYKISNPPIAGVTLIGTEIKFEIPTNVKSADGTVSVFNGVIDKLEQDSDGNYLVTDYKTFSRKPDSDMLVMNTQSMLYAKAVEILYGKKPTKMVWKYIKSTPADEPIFIEKSQRLSRAFSDKVTLESWNRACTRHCLEDALTDEEREKLIQNRSSYYFTVELPVLPIMVERIWKDFLKTVREMKWYSNSKVMNISSNCSWCDYKPICLAQCTGADVEYIKQKDYEKRERK